jgi:hypothetical protein
MCTLVCRSLLAGWRVRDWSPAPGCRAVRGGRAGRRTGAGQAAPVDGGRGRAAGGRCASGSLAGRDLAARCAEGRLDPPGQARSRAVRKRALTSESSSRWAGAITRISEDQVRLAGQNLCTERTSLQARIRRIEARLAVPADGKVGRNRGYATPAERHAKAVRLQSLKARLAVVERQLETGAVSVVRGGKALLRKGGSLARAGLTEAQWREQWESARPSARWSPPRRRAAPAPSFSRTSTSPRPALKDGNGRAADPRAAGAAGTSGAPSPASPQGNSAADWSRWPPTPGCRSSSSIPPIPLAGEPSTG